MSTADILTTHGISIGLNRIKESSRFHGWLVLAVAIPLYLTFLSSRSLDGHETLVAQTAREMLRSGDLVLPTFAGTPRYQKPPLAYWFTVMSYRWTGTVNETTARLPCALSGVLLAFLIYRVACRLFGSPAGLLAGLMQATMAWSYLYGRSALVDITLTLMVSVAILSSAMDRWSRQARWAPLIFWIAFGLAVLAKGPVALPIIVIPVLLYRWRRTRHLADVRFWTHPTTLIGIPVFLFLSFAWPIAVYRSNPAVLDLWYGQSVDRFLVHWGPNTRPWFFYLYQIPLLTLPWTPLWIVELVSSLRQRVWRRHVETEVRNLDEYRLLWTWFVTALVFFSLSEGKREHYVLPALPPLSVFAALALPKWGRYWQPWVRRHDRAIQASVYFLGTTLSLGVIVYGIGWMPPLVPVAVAGLFGTVCLSCAFRWNREPGSATWGIGFLVFGIAAALWLEACLAPVLGRRNEELALFARNRIVIQEADQIIQFGFNDRWTIFPIDRPMAWPRTSAELIAELESTQVPLLLLRADRVEEVTTVLEIEVIDQTRSETDLFPAHDHLVLARPIPEQGAQR